MAKRDDRKKREKRRAGKKSKKARKAAKLAAKSNDPSFLKQLTYHFRQLGLVTSNDRPDYSYRDRLPTDAEIKQYQTWCRNHSFSVKLEKDNYDRRRELSAHHREVMEYTLKQRRGFRNHRQTLELIFDGEIKAKDLDHQHELHKVAVEFTEKKYEYGGNAPPSTEPTDKARTLFLQVIDHTDLIKENYVSALCNLCRYDWIRDPADWIPKTHNSRRQFASLARHLLAKYDVPEFMDGAWGVKRNVLPTDSRDQRWFIHIGQGGNMRTAESLPFPLTKRMAHCFLQAPKSYTADEALMWGLVHSLNGDRRVVEALRPTAMMTDHANNEFWQSVIRFFVENPMLDTVHYGPIIDYIRNQKYLMQQVFVAPGQFENRPPPQPNFSMHRREVDSLLNQVESWHVRLGKESKHKQEHWPPCGLKAFSKTEGKKESSNQRIWRIHEILSKAELVSEGRAMRHCVGSYSGSCASGRSSIWSMTREDFNGRHRVLTIQVSNVHKQIQEARALRNELPDAKSKSILEQWTRQEGINIPGYIWSRRW